MHAGCWAGTQGAALGAVRRGMGAEKVASRVALELHEAHAALLEVSDAVTDHICLLLGPLERGELHVEGLGDGAHRIGIGIGKVALIALVDLIHHVGHLWAGPEVAQQLRVACGALSLMPLS